MYVDPQGLEACGNDIGGGRLKSYRKEMFEQAAFVKTSRSGPVWPIYLESREDSGRILLWSSDSAQILRFADIPLNCATEVDLNSLQASSRVLKFVSGDDGRELVSLPPGPELSPRQGHIASAFRLASQSDDTPFIGIVEDVEKLGTVQSQQTITIKKLTNLHRESVVCTVTFFSEPATCDGRVSDYNLLIASCVPQDGAFSISRTSNGATQDLLHFKPERSEGGSGRGTLCACFVEPSNVLILTASDAFWVNCGDDFTDSTTPTATLNAGSVSLNNQKLLSAFRDEKVWLWNIQNVGRDNAGSAQFLLGATLGAGSDYCQVIAFSVNADRMSCDNVSIVSDGDLWIDGSVVSAVDQSIGGLVGFSRWKLQPTASPTVFVSSCTSADVMVILNEAGFWKIMELPDDSQLRANVTDFSTNFLGVVRVSIAAGKQTAIIIGQSDGSVQFYTLTEAGKKHFDVLNSEGEVSPTSVIGGGLHENQAGLSGESQNGVSDSAPPVAGCNTDGTSKKSSGEAGGNSLSATENIAVDTLNPTPLFASTLQSGASGPFGSASGMFGSTSVKAGSSPFGVFTMSASPFANIFGSETRTESSPITKPADPFFQSVDGNARSSTASLAHTVGKASTAAKTFGFGAGRCFNPAFPAEVGAAERSSLSATKDKIPVSFATLPSALGEIAGEKVGAAAQTTSVDPAKNDAGKSRSSGDGDAAISLAYDAPVANDEGYGESRFCGPPAMLAGKLDEDRSPQAMDGCKFDWQYSPLTTLNHKEAESRDEQSSQSEEESDDSLEEKLLEELKRECGNVVEERRGESGSESSDEKDARGDATSTLPPQNGGLTKSAEKNLSKEVQDEQLKLSPGLVGSITQSLAADNPTVVSVSSQCRMVVSQRKEFEETKNAALKNIHRSQANSIDGCPAPAAKQSRHPAVEKLKSIFLKPENLKFDQPPSTLKNSGSLNSQVAKSTTRHLPIEINLSKKAKGSRPTKVQTSDDKLPGIVDLAVSSALNSVTAVCAYSVAAPPPVSFKNGAIHRQRETEKVSKISEELKRLQEEECRELNKWLLAGALSRDERKIISTSEISPLPVLETLVLQSTLVRECPIVFSEDIEALDRTVAGDYPSAEGLPVAQRVSSLLKVLQNCLFPKNCGTNVRVPEAWETLRLACISLTIKIHEALFIAEKAAVRFIQKVGASSQFPHSGEERRSGRFTVPDSFLTLQVPRSTDRDAKEVVTAVSRAVNKLKLTVLSADLNVFKRSGRHRQTNEHGRVPIMVDAREQRTPGATANFDSSAAKVQGVDSPKEPAGARQPSALDVVASGATARKPETRISNLKHGLEVTLRHLTEAPKRSQEGNDTRFHPVHQLRILRAARAHLEATRQLELTVRCKPATFSNCTLQVRRELLLAALAT